MISTKFKVDYCKNLCKCNRCMQAIPKNGIRFTKQVPYNPYIITYYHINCLFKEFQLANINTGHFIDSINDIENFDNIQQNDKENIGELVDILNKQRRYRTLDTPDHILMKRIGTMIQEKKIRAAPRKKTIIPEVYEHTPSLYGDRDEVIDDSDSESESDYVNRYERAQEANNIDDRFETFIRICNKISSESSDHAKTLIIKDFITKGSDGRGYKGDLKLLIHMLLPNYKNRSYDLNTTSMVQIFSFLFHANLDSMMVSLFHKNGDIAKTLRSYFRQSTFIQPQRRSKLTLREVDRYLNELSTMKTEDEQVEFFARMTSNCTLNDLEMIIRLIKKDLRLNMVSKVILDALAQNGYAAFALSGNLDDIIQRAQKLIRADGKPGVILMQNGTKIIRSNNNNTDIFKRIPKAK